MKTSDVFKTHPNLKSYHQTSDGVKFFTPHDAKVHARNLEDKTIKAVNRSANAENAPAKKESKKALNPMQQAKADVKEIATLETVEAVEAALEGKTASTVLKAGEERIDAIKESLKVEATAEPVTGEDVSTDNKNSK